MGWYKRRRTTPTRRYNLFSKKYTPTKKSRFETLLGTTR